MLALPLGVLSTRRPGSKLATTLERGAWLAQGVPGIVIALALISATVGTLPWLYESTALLLLAYAILFMPYALVGIRAALLQAERQLEEAGRSLGLNWFEVLVRITLPLAAPGLGAAAALVFIAVTTELTATLLLAPIGTETLAIRIWDDTSTLAFAAAAPFAAILVALSLTASLILARRFDLATVRLDLGGLAMAELRIAGLTKRFGGKTVLDGLDLVVPSGELLVVLGPSGCGKTTLLRLIAGFERADAGTIRIGEEAVVAPGLYELPERRRIGYLAQEGALFPHLTVARNIGFGLRGRPDRGRRVAELIEMVGLAGEYANRFPHELSGGEQQRVALARALAPAPRLVLLDEPFSALDAALRQAVRDTVAAALKRAGATAVMVTHDQAEAFSMGDHVAVLRMGRIAQIGDPVSLYRHPADPALAQFVGEAVLIPGVAAEGRATSALGTFPLAVGMEGPVEGSVEVMIRPEQIRLTAPGAVGSRPALVCDVTFYGHDAVVRLTLSGEPGGSISARLFGQDVPRPGQAVGVAVEGEVIAYPAASSSP